MNRLLQPCYICKNKINIEKDDFYYDAEHDRYIHRECYISKQVNKKRGAKTQDEANKLFDNLKLQGLKEIQDKINYYQFFNWVQYTYSLVYISKSFITKIDNLISGNDKNFSCKINIEDLFDMWKRKINELNKIAQNNTTKGKRIDGLMRINYDLAIILSKYDSYLIWKENQKLLEQNNTIQNENINFNKINKIVDNNTKKNNNINDILDDIGW